MCLSFFVCICAVASKQQLVATENCAMRKRRCCAGDECGASSGDECGASSGGEGKSGGLTARDLICLELRDLQVAFCSFEFVFEFFFTSCLNLNPCNDIMCLNLLLEFEFVQRHVCLNFCLCFCSGKQTAARSRFRRFWTR